MREYSLDSLTNDTEDVVGTVTNPVFEGDNDDSSDTSDREEPPLPTTETPSVASEAVASEAEVSEAEVSEEEEEEEEEEEDSIMTDSDTPAPPTNPPEATTNPPFSPINNDQSSPSNDPISSNNDPISPNNDPISSNNDPSSLTGATSDTSDINSGSASAGSSYNWNNSGLTDLPTSAPNAATASPFTILPNIKPMPPTLTPTLTPTPTTNSSAYESDQQVTSSKSATSMPGGVIAAVVVGAACVMFVVAAFVTTKKKKELNASSQRFSQSKVPCLGDSQTVPIPSSRLAPAGMFGKLQSGRNEREEPEMGSFFAVSSGDPFTRKHMHKGGIWDDPVLVAARIPLEEIHIEELLARGGFGQVFLANYNGQRVAVKTLLSETAQDMNEIEALFAETKVMAKLEHPCIVSFVGIAWGSLSTICCVIEYVDGGDLRALLNGYQENQSRARGFDHDKVKIAMDIVQGLTYLHSREPNILHRDLKSRNVLLTSQLNAKLTDFGVSRERSDDLMTNAVGTSLWMAPEVMMGGRYDGKADVFSFGVVLSELDTHLMPYANVRNANGRKPTEAVLLQMVVAGTMQVEFSRHCPLEIITLAHACISVNPRDRPTAAEALYQLQAALEEQEVTL